MGIFKKGLKYDLQRQQHADNTLVLRLYNGKGNHLPPDGPPACLPIRI